LDLPVSRMTAAVPRPAALRSTIRARQTCFCGLLGSATMARNRRRSVAVTVKEMPLRMLQNRMSATTSESQIGLFRSDQSTRSGIRGACTGTTTGTTTFSTDLTQATEDYYNGMIISFLSGSNGDTARMITDYSSTNGTITVSPDLPNGTAAGNNFVIWGTAAANLHAVHDNKDAASRFERYLDAMTAGTVTGTPSSDAFDTTLTVLTVDHYEGSYIGFISGDLDGQYRQITAYDGGGPGNGRITVSPAFNGTPANGSGFIIFGCAHADIGAIGGDSTAAANQKAMYDGTGYGGGTTPLGANVKSIRGNATAAINLLADYDGTGYAKAASTIGTCGSLADGAITAAVVATGAWEEAADQVMIRATSNFEASAPKKSLATAVMQAVHRVDDDGTGSLDIYRSNGTVVHATRAVTTNAALDPIDELGGAT